MSAASASGASSDRLLTFEVAGTVYALPISEVLEVVESGRVTCVPSMPKSHGGVMNWHGEALPVVTPALLLDSELLSSESLDSASVDGGEGPAEQQERRDAQYLVVTDRAEENARLSLPIDRVIGLVDGHVSRLQGPDVVAERKPVDGRVVSVINPRRLVERAAKVIENAVG
ncbi:MAG: chemotaxis protein CheW [Deltaproteobacteria bacterium]|nr:chemotaxis protein CheW [Deltaproteobacteria bacterium]MBW2416967.1 chemotaxis protein CheW [Deltaproteobacteria bacterium]